MLSPVWVPFHTQINIISFSLTFCNQICLEWPAYWKCKVGTPTYCLLPYNWPPFNFPTSFAKICLPSKYRKNFQKGKRRTWWGWGRGGGIMLFKASCFFIFQKLLGGQRSGTGKKIFLMAVWRTSRSLNFPLLWESVFLNSHVLFCLDLSMIPALE